MLQAVAEGLGDLNSEVVFVGGATTALYIDDEGAPTPTPSDDVDFIVELKSGHAFAELERKLRERGFSEPPFDRLNSHPICRKIFRGIQVDVMPTSGAILGFTNAWYSEGINFKESRKLPNGTEIFIFNEVYFLASKLEAFDNRGKDDDLRLSQDMEDILALLDGCSYLESGLANASQGVRNYIKSQFQILMKDKDLLEEAASGFIRIAGDNQARVRRIVRRVASLSR